MAVYFLQFEQPLGNPGNRRGQAQYYVGFCEDRPGQLQRRLAQHHAGTGAAITRAAVERGISFDIVYVIPDATREDERRIKQQKNHRRVLNRLLKPLHHCPDCPL